MKRALIFAALLALGGLQVSQVCAQTAKDLAKERRTISRLSEQELNSRATKAARQEAKRLKKDGWLVSPGALPMDKQLDKAYKMQFEYDDNAFPKYLMGEAMSTGQNYDAAKVQALELAKLNLAGQVQTEITALVENTVSNSQLDAGEASSIVETVNASKNVISQSLGRVIPVMECYRKTREIVESHKDQVTLIANALFEKETITAAEIAYLLEHGQLPHYDEAKSAEAVAVSDAFAQYQPRNVNNITLIPEYVQFYREVDDIVSHGLKHLVICASTPTSGPMDASQFRSQVTAAFPDGQVGVLFITPNEMKGISATVDTVAQHLEKYSGCSTLLVLTNEESLEAIKQIIRAL